MEEGGASLGERRALGFSRDDIPIKKLTSDPVASPPENHLETKRTKLIHRSSRDVYPILADYEKG
jgi:hypothetical protein